ncbi:hypothetical protein BH10CYA1_BH10CYA1_59220 [soil metagenome]
MDGQTMHLRKLSALINFANDRYGTDDELLLKTNPVSRLSRNRSWHRIYPRQGIIPDHKLKHLYLAVSTLHHEVARDFLLFLLFTGMRFGETRKLKWCHVDFENKILTVLREITKVTESIGFRSVTFWSHYSENVTYTGNIPNGSFNLAG